LSKVTSKNKYVNFDETFLLITMLKFIRILLAIVAYRDYEIWQMNVKTIFLNGNLQKDVYMKVLNLRNLSVKFVSYKSQFINLNKLQGVGISILMK
jgi:hypothetical protein